MFGNHGFFPSTGGVNPMVHDTKIQPPPPQPSTFAVIPAAPTGAPGVTIGHNPSGSYAFAGPGPMVGATIGHPGGLSVSGSAGPAGVSGSASITARF